MTAVETSVERSLFMDTDSKNMVEVYDNATGQHYFRECTAEELSFYEDLAREQEALKLEQPIIEA